MLVAERIFRRLLLCIVVLGAAGDPLPAFAESAAAASLRADRDRAIETGDYALAAARADALYEELRASAGHATVTADAAYAAGRLLSVQRDYATAAERFKTCAAMYRSLEAGAQEIDSLYMAAEAVAKSGRKATAIGILKSAVNRLERRAQEDSPLAGRVFLKLAGLHRPPPLGDASAARKNYRRVENYARRAEAIFTEQGPGGEPGLALAVELLATAAEGLDDFEASATYFGEALAMQKRLNPNDEQTIEYLETRHYTMLGKSNQDPAKKTVSALTGDGREVELTVKKRPRVKYPLNVPAKGLVVVSIALGADGRPADLEIVTSTPTPEFGKAVVEALRTWTFVPPAGIEPGDIQPFRYSFSFSAR